LTGRLLIVPAAGTGSRLGGSVPKPLVSVCGRPMLEHIFGLYTEHVDRVVVVVSPAARAAVEAWRGDRSAIAIAEQAEPTGMLDAILAAEAAVREAQPAEVWISWADQIGVRPATVKRLASLTGTAAPALTLPTVHKADPYIHFERDRNGRIARLLQRREGDAMPPRGESDIGLFALSARTFTVDLPAYAVGVERGAGTGERNFVPFVPWLSKRASVVSFPCTDPMEALGVNTPEDLRAMEQWLTRQ